MAKKVSQKASVISKHGKNNVYLHVINIYIYIISHTYSIVQRTPIYMIGYVKNSDHLSFNNPSCPTNADLGCEMGQGMALAQDMDFFCVQKTVSVQICCTFS